MAIEQYDGSTPPHMTLAEYEQMQQSTPSTFAGHAPVLRLRLDNVQCLLQPDLACPQAISAADQANGSSFDAVRTGTLYITDAALFFSPTSSSSGGAFKLEYPSLSLHAISRSLPSALHATHRSSDADAGCIYCQLDSSTPASEQAEEETEDDMAELWLLPASQDKLEPLFEALSCCASLYPSVSGDGDDDAAGGHPFSSVGPFGTGLLGQSSGNGRASVEDGAFDDADENAGQDEGGVQLSETGRNTLARLDALVDWSAMDAPRRSVVSSPTASFHSSAPRKAAAGPEQSGSKSGDKLSSMTAKDPTNTLILVHLPQEVFHHPPLASALLDLLHAYGELHSWTPLPSFGRAIITYKMAEDAQQAKEALDRLMLPLLDEGEEEDDEAAEESETLYVRKQEKGLSDGFALRAYYGDTAALTSLYDAKEEDHLPVPSTDRNFLISPPGSPPVGWEPIREDAPNTNTLADDLIRALGSLRDRGLGVVGHTPDILKDDKGDGDGAETATYANASHRRTPSASTLMPPPSVVIPPRQAAVRSNHPLAREAYDVGADEFDEQGTVSLPGVVVQSVDPEPVGGEEGLEKRFNHNLSISSVKATVESMRGGGILSSSGTLYDGQHDAQSALAGSKITPTARPPM